MPWAVRAGLRCPDLLCLYYERHLGDDLQELRAWWRVVAAPPPPAHLAPRLGGGRGEQVQSQSQQGGANGR